MELECGSHKGGWMRIADLNTTRGDICPSVWITLTQPLVCVASINNIICDRACENQPCSHVKIS